MAKRGETLTFQSSRYGKKEKMVNLDDVCEWLKENIWVYLNYEGCSGEELENDIIEDFRKAMEE